MNFTTIDKQNGGVFFSMLVLSIFQKNGIDKYGFRVGGPAMQTEEDAKWEKETLENFGFDEKFERVVLDEWNRVRRMTPLMTPVEFLEIFKTEFHFLMFDPYAPEDIKARNVRMKKAYGDILEVIRRIQLWQEDELLRTRVESDFRGRGENWSTIYQCSTAFCLVSLGCDQSGVYSIVYSVDHRFQKMISEIFASKLLYNIYLACSGDLSVFVRIGSLYEDCVSILNQLIVMAQSNEAHSITVVEKS